MRRFLLRLIVIETIFFLTYCAKASGSELELTTADITEVSNTLQAYQGGKISLNAITVDRDEAWGRKLLTYFVTHTNDVTTKMKLPISRCFAGFGKYPEALQLAQEYVSVFTNDWHGWRIIGSANALMGNWNAALNAYTNDVLLGDEDSSAALGSAALKANRLDVFREFLPQLFRLKNSQSDKAIEATAALVIYALRTEQKDIFVKALKGINPKEILAHEGLPFLVKQGCKEFKGNDIDRIRQELEAAAGTGSSLITTNAPSP